MIPVIGIPYINQLDLFLDELKSIDETTGEIVIIDNSPNSDLKNLEGPANFRVVCTKSNIGVSASWNLIIKTTPQAPWWFIANSDILFSPGELSRVAHEMNDFDGVVKMIGLAAFGVSRKAIATAGFFDENFIPAYCEDLDWLRRCSLTGVEIKDIEPEMKSRHVGSSVIKSDNHYWIENARTYPENVRYYETKWGGSIEGGETFNTPFNKGGNPSEWHLDVNRLAELSWR